MMQDFDPTPITDSSIIFAPKKTAPEFDLQIFSMTDFIRHTGELIAAIRSLFGG